MSTLHRPPLAVRAIARVAMASGQPRAVADEIQWRLAATDPRSQLDPDLVADVTVRCQFPQASKELGEPSPLVAHMIKAVLEAGGLDRCGDFLQLLVDELALMKSARKLRAAVEGADLADVFRSAARTLPGLNDWERAAIGRAVDEAEQAVLDRDAKVTGANPSRAGRLEASTAGGDDVVVVTR